MVGYSETIPALCNSSSDIGSLLLGFGSAKGAGFDSARCPTRLSYAWGQRSDRISIPLRQKCCTLPYFPVPIQTDTLPSASKPLTNNHGYTVPIGYNSFVKSARSLHPRPERREPGQGHHHRLPICTDSSSTPRPPESYRSYCPSLLFGRGCSDRPFGCGCSVP